MKSQRKLSRHTKIYSDDGYYGELSDVVVDSGFERVEFLVVAPEGPHSQNRLVPAWLLNQDDDRLTVSLTTRYINQLQRVFPDEFVRIIAKPATYEEFDVGFRTVLFPPYYDDDRDLTQISTAALPAHGLRPIDNAIRRGSECVGAGDRHIGVVEGFLTRTGEVTAIVIRTTTPTGRVDFVAPLELVSASYPNMVVLTVTKPEFLALPTTKAIEHRPGASLARLQGHFSQARARVPWPHR